MEISSGNVTRKWVKIEHWKLNSQKIEVLRVRFSLFLRVGQTLIKNKLF